MAASRRLFVRFRSTRTSIPASGHGDKSGHSTYHSMLIKLDKRYAVGLDAERLVCALEAADGCRQLRCRQLAPRITTTAAWKSRSASTIRRTASSSTTSYELPFGKGKAMLTSGVVSCDTRRLAHRRRAPLRAAAILSR